MNESYQEEIDKLIAKFSLVILAELGHKLPMDQVKSLVKAWRQENIIRIKYK